MPLSQFFKHTHTHTHTHTHHGQHTCRHTHTHTHILADGDTGQIRGAIRALSAVASSKNCRAGAVYESVRENAIRSSNAHARRRGLRQPTARVRAQRPAAFGKLDDAARRDARHAAAAHGARAVLCAHAITARAVARVQHRQRHEDQPGTSQPAVKHLAAARSVCWPTRNRKTERCDERRHAWTAWRPVGCAA